MTARLMAMGLCLIVSGCATTGTDHKGTVERPQPAMERVKVADSDFTLKQMDEFIRRITKLDLTGRQTEAGDLQRMRNPAPRDHLKLAYLLSLENATLDDLKNAQTQLDGLEAAFADPDARLYVRLLQRTVAEETAHKQEKKRADELQEKLNQIKELELELMKRSQAKPAARK
jgi:hypothetical protein